MNDEKKIWEELCTRFGRKISAEAFQKWFMMVSLKEIDECLGVVVLETYSEQACNILNYRYKEILDEIMASVLGPNFEVFVKVKHDEPVEELIEDIHQRLLELECVLIDLKALYEKGCSRDVWIKTAEREGIIQILDY